MSLQKQVYNPKQEPDKEGGLDHPVDAAGYFHVKRWPVDEGVMKSEGLRL
jgi:hypothetical protein